MFDVDPCARPIRDLGRPRVHPIATELWGIEREIIESWRSRARVDVPRLARLVRAAMTRGPR